MAIEAGSNCDWFTFDHVLLIYGIWWLSRNGGEIIEGAFSLVCERCRCVHVCGSPLVALLIETKTFVGCYSTDIAITICWSPLFCCRCYCFLWLRCCDWYPIEIISWLLCCLRLCFYCHVQWWSWFADNVINFNSFENHCYVVKCAQGIFRLRCTKKNFTTWNEHSTERK